MKYIVELARNALILITKKILTNVVEDNKTRILCPRYFVCLKLFNVVKLSGADVFEGNIILGIYVSQWTCHGIYWNRVCSCNFDCQKAQ